jgi:hypothetical protein
MYHLLRRNEHDSRQIASQLVQISRPAALARNDADRQSVPRRRNTASSRSERPTWIATMISKPYG